MISNTATTWNQVGLSETKVPPSIDWNLIILQKSGEIAMIGSNWAFSHGETMLNQPFSGTKPTLTSWNHGSYEWQLYLA